MPASIVMAQSPLILRRPPDALSRRAMAAMKPLSSYFPAYARAMERPWSAAGRQEVQHGPKSLQLEDLSTPKT